MEKRHTEARHEIINTKKNRSETKGRKKLRCIYKILPPPPLFCIECYHQHTDTNTQFIVATGWENKCIFWQKNSLQLQLRLVQL